MRVFSRIAFLACLLAPGLLRAQFTDNFSDGNFTAAPVWTGETARYTVNGTFQLQSQGLAATDTIYLATPSTIIDSAEWEFWIRLNFAPSANNYVRIYLVSDQQDLRGALNGYFIQIGENLALDGIDIFRQDGLINTLILSGVNGTMALTNSIARIRVRRDDLGNWQLYTDLTGGNTFTLEGTATDATYATTSWFGVSCRHTSTNGANYFFDDFYAGGYQIDTTEATVVSATAMSATTVDVQFSELVIIPSAQTNANYTASNGLGNPTTAVIDGTDPSLVHLTFGTPFTNGFTYTLSVLAVSDTAGNLISPAQNATFNWFVPDVPVARDVLINEIYADPDSAVANMPNGEFIEIYNRSNKIFDLAGWKFRDAASTVTLGTHILLPGDYLILCKSADTAALNLFGTTLVVNLPSLNNAGDQLGLRSPADVLIDSVDYDISWYQDVSKQNGGWSLERINPEDSCSLFGNWIASNDVDGGTPGTINSVFNNSPDITPPSFVSITVTGTNTIDVCFDETMDATTLNNASNYSVNNGLGTPTSAVAISPANACVTLTFAAVIDTGTIYTATFSNLADCNGNVAATFNQQFVLATTPAPFDVVINELFPDPTPAVGLPVQEFIELHNRGTSVLELNGLILTDGTTDATLTNYVLQPGAYVILTATANVSLFTPFGSVLGLANFPSLNNAGDSIVLHTLGGTIIDQVIYDISWYQDVAKQDGGWTLERINPNDTCSMLGNWIASNDALGGTPGTQNSVNDLTPDNTAPQFVSLVATSATTIDICFDETMDAAALTNAANYTIDNGIGNPVSAVAIAPVDACVTLTLGSAIDTGTVYTITFSNMADCKGNALSTFNQTFVLATSPAPFQVVLNELFPDPTPFVGLPEQEFIELYNRGTTVVELNGLVLTDGSTDATLSAFVLQPGAYVILTATANVSLFTPFGNVIGLSSFPTLNNTGDSIVLHNAVGTVIDQVIYDISWYQDDTKDDGGWTLERINPTDTCGFLGNWIASNDLNGGTPGIQNSVFDNTPDNTAPQFVSITTTSATTIDVCFDESMDAAALGNVTNYSIDNGIGTPTAAFVISPINACVTLTLSTPVDTGTVYTVTFSNLADCKGNAASTFTETFVLGASPAPFEIVINELFPDPSPVIGLPGQEFIELHNPGTSVIELNGLVLTDGTSDGILPAFTLFPGAYVILTSTANTALYAPFGDVIGVSSLPSLNNTDDSLVLQTAGGVMIDIVMYTDEWYHDASKADGGWTLERKDASFTCMNEFNWSASTNSSGGTPGTVNSNASTFVDAIAPTVDRAVLIDPSLIRVYFDEAMDPASLTDPLHYTIDNGIGNPIICAPVGTTPLAVELLLSAPLDSNIVYCLTVTGTADCPGNLIGTSNTTCFGIPLPADSGDLVINEILFNPYTGGTDYVELVNLSDKILDLSSLQIGEIFEGTDSVFNANAAADESYLLLPGKYVCLTTDKNFQLITYLPLDPDAILEISTFPSYDDTEGECVITRADGLVLDRFYFLDDYHFPNLDDKEGVSLERLQFTAPSQDPGNWHSAASSVRFGTPGYENSQLYNGGDGSGTVWLSPETFSPDNDGVDDVLFIHYLFQDPGINAKASVFDSRGRFVKTIKQNTLLGTDEGTFTWDGTTEAGHKADVGIYVVLFEATRPADGKTMHYKLGCVLAARF